MVVRIYDDGSSGDRHSMPDRYFPLTIDPYIVREITATQRQFRARPDTNFGATMDHEIALDDTLSTLPNHHLSRSRYLPRPVFPNREPSSTSEMTRNPETAATVDQHC